MIPISSMLSIATMVRFVLLVASTLKNDWAGSMGTQTESLKPGCEDGTGIRRNSGGVEMAISRPNRTLVGMKFL